MPASVAPPIHVGPDLRQAAARGTRIAVCFAAAVALQGAGWHFAAVEILSETPGGAAPRMARVRVEPVSGSRPSADAPNTAAVVGHAPAPAPAARPLASRVEPTGDGTGTSGHRPFYDYHEVDVAAEPVGDWNLDPTALDRLATSRIVFTIFVGSDGTPLHCRVDAPDRLDADARHELAEKLCETEMRPARRGGVAVASRRRIELFTDGKG